MFGKKKNENSVDINNLNDVISLSKKILKIAFILLIIGSLYAGIMVLKELKILDFFINILKILTPLFIGLVIAWLFDPVVTRLKKKGIKRVFGAIIIYVALIIVVFIVISALIPVLSSQISDFANMIPSVVSSITDFIDSILDKVGEISNFNVEGMKADVINSLQSLGTNLTSSLPSITVDFVKGLFSGLGTILIGAIIGFYLLVSFDSADDIVNGFIPKKFRLSTKGLLDKINNSLRKYVHGTLMLALLVFVLSSIGFFISGLKAPLLFGLFCGLTDIIPYLGPYIGGIPAVVVGFSQSPIVGIITLVAIVIIQFIEGNLLQPLIMSKQLKVHPVTIMIGLLIFGYFFGVIGMILATPIIASLKILLAFLDEKYNILPDGED